VLVSSLAAELTIPCMAGYNMSKAALSALAETLMDEARGPPVAIIDFRPGDYRTDFNRGMEQRGHLLTPRSAPVWARAEANLKAAPGVSRAAADLRRALARGRSATLRSGGFFQKHIAPLLTPFPFRLQRWVRAAYFGNQP
jgi:short-subunit dehydrogenase